MLPSTFKPKTAEDFIGSARKAAKMLTTLHTAAAGAPLKLLLLGDPGIGKTSLVDWFLSQIQIDTFASVKSNGTGFKIDEAAQLEESFRLTTLFANLTRVIRIEEIDKVPHAAQVRLLTALDDMPRNTMFIGTSNCKPGDLEERFHSRFQVLEMKPPSDDEVTELLRSHWETTLETAQSIAALAQGNVRQALLDLQTSLFAIA